MDLVLKNVQKKHLPLISELAKTLKIELSEPDEDDKYYLAAMEDGRNSELLSEGKTKDFLVSLRSK